MYTLAIKTERVNVLSVKLENAEKQVQDLLTERAIIKSCVSDITSLLLDVIETRESMITISVRKHLNEKLMPIFIMLHRLQGISDQTFVPKQGGEGGSTIMTRKEGPKAPTKPIFKQKPNGKGKLLGDEPIVDNSEDEEELNEDELKRRKVHETKLDENNRIIREAEEKEMADEEAQATLQSRKILFPKWNLKRIKNDAVDLPS